MVFVERYKRNITLKVLEGVPLAFGLHTHAYDHSCAANQHNSTPSCLILFNYLCPRNARIYIFFILLKTSSALKHILVGI